MSGVQTIERKISDTAIRELAATGCRQIKDPRWPLYFRYHKNRRQGSWYLVRHRGRSAWSFIGRWPSLLAARLIPQIPERVVGLALNQSVAVDHWDQVGPLLTWYGERIQADHRLSASRRASTKSVIKCHLAPALQHELIGSLTRDRLDQVLLWPLQNRYSLAQVRQVLAVLKRAFRLAAQLQKIRHNPLADWVFSDFVSHRVTPREGRLQIQDLPDLVRAWHTFPPDQLLLPLLMLLHGTRINETRRLRWRYLDEPAALLTLPGSETKNGQAHQIPITDPVLQLLRAYRLHCRQRGYQGDYLFPGVRGQAVSKSAVQRWFKAWGAGVWSSHDLRKLARTVWTDLGVDYFVGEALLNHALKDLDAAYIHSHLLSQKRQALTQYHSHLANRGLDLAQLLPALELSRLHQINAA